MSETAHGVMVHGSALMLLNRYLRLGRNLLSVIAENNIDSEFERITCSRRSLWERMNFDESFIKGITSNGAIDARQRLTEAVELDAEIEKHLGMRLEMLKSDLSSVRKTSAAVVTYVPHGEKRTTGLLDIKT